MKATIFITFPLYLILVPDIEKEEYTVHRLQFEHREVCLHFAKALDQVRDPIARKKQCRPTKNYTYPEEKSDER